MLLYYSTWAPLSLHRNTSITPHLYTYQPDVLILVFTAKTPIDSKWWQLMKQFIVQRSVLFTKQKDPNSLILKCMQNKLYKSNTLTTVAICISSIGTDEPAQQRTLSTIENSERVLRGHKGIRNQTKTFLMHFYKLRNKTKIARVKSWWQNIHRKQWILQ